MKICLVVVMLYVYSLTDELRENYRWRRCERTQNLYISF
jgi:hypothetical protein